MGQPHPADPREPAGRGRSDAGVAVPATPPFDPDATVILPTLPHAGAPVPPTGAASPPGAAPPPGATSPAGAAPGPASRGDIGRNSAVMAAGSLVSRLTGFMRTVLITAALGKLVNDAYTNATLFPGMVYELLLGGVLSSILVPLLVRARDTDPDHGDAYTQRLLTGAAVILGATTVVAVACAPLLALSVSNPDNHALTTTWSYLTLPMIFFMGLAALFAAVLNTRGHFAAPAWAPILNNIILCIAAGLLFALPGPAPTLDNVSTTTVLVIGIGTLLGISVQAFGLWPALRKVGFRWKWRFDLRKLHLGEIARLGGWMICYVAANQVAVIVIGKLANSVGRQRDAGITIYNNAFLLMMMAHGIVAVSVITALLPRISAAATHKRYHEMTGDLAHSMRLVIVLLTPVSVMYVALSQPLAFTLFRHGNFGHSEAVALGLVTAAAGLALLPLSISQMQTFAFWGMADTKTPALVNLPVVGVRIVVDVALWAAVLAPVAFTAGLMVGNAVSFVVAMLISGAVLRRRIGRIGLRAIAATALKAAGAGAVALVIGYGFVLAMRLWTGTGFVASAVTLAVGGLIMGAAYVLTALALRTAEISEALAMVRRRLGR